MHTSKKNSKEQYEALDGGARLRSMSNNKKAKRFYEARKDKSKKKQPYIKWNNKNFNDQLNHSNEIERIQQEQKFSRRNALSVVHGTSGETVNKI